ncbi:MAG: hypothetical protein RRB13_10035 [bacterium]|nr:hypothetical protein [bacterium]
MFDAIRPFVRLLVLAVFLWCAGYLSYFTPRHLFAGEGFTEDLWLCLITMGITTGILYFTRVKLEEGDAGFYMAGDDDQQAPPQDPPAPKD